jgi:plastocyanin
MRATTFNFAVLTLALSVGAAGVSSGAFAADAPAAAHQYTVTIANMAFGKLPASLKVGDTITFVNNDAVPHTVTARDHSFDLRLAPRKSDKLTLKKAGSFPFYCIYHVAMKGTLTVAP